MVNPFFKNNGPYKLSQILNELKINVNSVILSNYEDSDQSFDIIDSKWIKELEEKIWYFYNS